MTEPNSHTEKPEDEPIYDDELLRRGLRCDRCQYKMLKICSDNKDTTTWNEWREQHPEKEILLEGADLENAHLNGANLENAHLKNANIINAHLEGATLTGASLHHAQFMGAIVDISTSMWKVKVDRWRVPGEGGFKNQPYTDFSGVALQNIIVDPSTKQLIEYNVRRKYWYKWMTEKNWYEVFRSEEDREERSLPGKWARWLMVRPFLWTTDYGLLTGRIIITLFGLAFGFALVYWLWPSCLMVNCTIRDIGFWHALYFSVVTMTTLGFGDMYANAQSIWGHILLTIQVILGYVLLGALITRFAVLFTAGGPAGKFADEEKEDDGK